MGFTSAKSELSALGLTILVTRKTRIVQWCNGSTTGFGSVCGGSNPPWTTFTEKRVAWSTLFS